MGADDESVTKLGVRARIDGWPLECLALASMRFTTRIESQREMEPPRRPNCSISRLDIRVLSNLARNLGLSCELRGTVAAGTCHLLRPVAQSGEP
jgi:hypothetical protein